MLLSLGARLDVGEWEKWPDFCFGWLDRDTNNQERTHQRKSKSYSFPKPGGGQNNARKWNCSLAFNMHLLIWDEVGNGNPIQCSGLENSTDRGVWWATVQGGHKESDMTEWMSTSFGNYRNPLELI